MPSNEALQVFYGTLPLILILLAVWLREQLMLKDILNRLLELGKDVKELGRSVASVDKRLGVLETRAGIVFRD